MALPTGFESGRDISVVLTHPYIGVYAQFDSRPKGMRGEVEMYGKLCVRKNTGR